MGSNRVGIRALATSTTVLELEAAAADAGGGDTGIAVLNEGIIVALFGSYFNK
jgi:Ethanolamine utilization protein EutJ (predicted chaperonin)